MLGSSALNLKYQTISDFCSPADYLDYMFGGVDGIMYRVTINPTYRQSFFRASGLIKAQYSAVDNCYVSMNAFYRTKDLNPNMQTGRDVPHLKRLNAFYVDLDCYKLGLSKKEVLMELEDNYIGSKIPEPTFIIDSGRGIYLVWKLRNEDKKALPRWAAVQQYLTDALEALGADQACTDAARILRVPFSRNAKSKSAVKILEFNDLTYSIYDIAKEYDIKGNAARKVSSKKKSGVVYPYNHATEKQRKYVRDIAGRLGLPEDAYPDFTNFHETDNWIKLHKVVENPDREDKGYCYKKGKTYSLTEYKAIRGVLGAYCAEIRKLFAMRTGANCKRELGLFLYRYFLREMKNDSDTALKETLAFNASLDCTFEESYVETVTASADRRMERGIPYAYRKSTIIKVLDITSEELKSLPFLASGVKSRKERKKEANRKAYESRLAAEGKAAKKDAILKRRASILAMQEQGKNAAEIQKELGISKATYHRDIAALATESVLSAVRAVISDQIENIKNTVEKAAEAVSGVVENVKKTDVAGAVHAALSNLKNKAQAWVSHLFSIPFIDMNTVGVLHGGAGFPWLSSLLQWLIGRKSGDRSGDGPADSTE